MIAGRSSHLSSAYCRVHVPVTVDARYLHAAAGQRPRTVPRRPSGSVIKQSKPTADSHAGIQLCRLQYVSEMFLLCLGFADSVGFVDEFMKCVSRVAQLRDGAKSANAGNLATPPRDGPSEQENRPPRPSSRGSAQGQNQPARSTQATNPSAYYPSYHYASAAQPQFLLPHMAQVQLENIRQLLGYDEPPSSMTVRHVAPQRTRLEQPLSARERAMPMAVISDGPQPTGIFSKFQAIAQNGPLCVSYTPERKSHASMVTRH